MPPASTTDAPSDPELIHKIELLEKQRIAAVLAHDENALGQLLSDSLVYCHSTGEIDTKKSYINRIATGQVRYISIEATVDRATEGIRGTAIAVGQLNILVEVNGAPVDVRAHYMTVWRHDEHGWKLEALHSAKR